MSSFKLFCATACIFHSMLPYSAIGQILSLKEDDVCKTVGSNEWRCQRLDRCPQVGDFRKNPPAICKFEGKMPIICCPPEVKSLGNNQKLVDVDLAKAYCSRYSMSECHKFNTVRIRRATATYNRVVVGGKKSKPKSHPHMALIGYGPDSSLRWLCGGSLISAQFVLSAAHCSQHSTFGPARKVRLGELDLSTGDESNSLDFLIDEIIVHPDYKPPSMYNDIALFKLDYLVYFNDWMKPACLFTDFDIPRDKAVATGWGRTAFDENTSDSLLEVELTLMNDTTCKRLHSKPSKKIPQGFNSRTQLCAGEAEGGKDTCGGDSGGPLVISKPDKCLKFLVGITSFGKMCALANSPGIYTRVSTFAPWVQSIVWAET